MLSAGTEKGRSEKSDVAGSRQLGLTGVMLMYCMSSGTLAGAYQALGLDCMVPAMLHPSQLPLPVGQCHAIVSGDVSYGKYRASSNRRLWPPMKKM